MSLASAMPAYTNFYHWLVILVLYSQLTLGIVGNILAFNSSISMTTRISTTVLRWRYCIVSQINVAVVGAHIVWTEHWFCNWQTRLLGEFSCCWSGRQDCDVWRVRCRTNIFIRSTFSTGTSWVGQAEVHVRSVRISVEATSTGRNERLGHCAVDRRRRAVRPLHASTPRTARTSNTRETLNAASLVDVFQHVTERSRNTQLSTIINISNHHHQQQQQQHQYTGISYNTDTVHIVNGPRGGATVLKVGDNFASGASKKFFLTPPLFGQWGDKILLR